MILCQLTLNCSDLVLSECFAFWFQHAYSPEHPPTPHPYHYTDKWDSVHVRMPCSPQSEFPVNNKVQCNSIVLHFHLSSESHMFCQLFPWESLRNNWIYIYSNIMLRLHLDSRLTLYPMPLQWLNITPPLPRKKKQVNKQNLQWPVRPFVFHR